MKRFFCVMLALVLLVGVLPLTAAAADTDTAGTGASYNLWLGTTQVTDANKNDILNDGKAKFDPSTGTLTLNNPYINSYYKGDIVTSQIYSTGINLKIVGSYSMSTDKQAPDRAIYLKRGDLTLDGDFVLLAEDMGILVQGTDLTGRTSSDGKLTIAGGSVEISRIAIGDYFYPRYGIYVQEDIIVSSEVEYVKAVGNRTAIVSDHAMITVQNPLRVISPEGGVIIGGEIYESDGNTEAQQVEIYAPEKRTYNVWLGSVQVSEANKNDILNDGGKAKYDPDTNTLTLDDPSIPGNYNRLGIAYKIYAEGIDLTVKGSYHYETPLTERGIYCNDGSLTLDGDFTIPAQGTAIGAFDDLIINGGTIIAKSKNSDNKNVNGLQSVYGKIIIGPGVTMIEAQSGICAVYANGGVTLDPSLSITTPTGGVKKSGRIYESDGSTMASDVIIQPSGCVITFDPDGGTGSMPNVRVKKGEKYTLPECAFAPPAGKEFRCWQVGTYMNPGSNFIVSMDTVVKAVWRNADANSCTVSFDPNGGSGMMANVKVNKGSFYNAPECTFTAPEGRQFSHWTVNGERFDGGTIRENTVLKANWVGASVSYISCTITAPKAGEKPSYTITVPKGAAYKQEWNYTGDYWCDGVIWEEVDGDLVNYRSGYTFRPGTAYKVTISLVPAGSATFAQLSALRGYVNDEEAECFRYNASNVTLVYTFPKLPGDSGYTVSGTATSFISDTDDTAILLLQGGSEKGKAVVKGSSAAYSIASVAPGDYVLRVSKKNHVTRDYAITVSGNTEKDVQLNPLGDINGDGATTVADYNLAKAHMKGNTLLEDYMLACADVAGDDGKITVTDVNLIRSHFKGSSLLY